MRRALLLSAALLVSPTWADEPPPAPPPDQGAPAKAPPPSALDQALYEAAEKGDADAVRALVARGADVNAVAALEIAVGLNRLEAARLLVSLGADVNKKDSSGDTALTGIVGYAVNPPMAIMLIESGRADLEHVGSLGRTVLDIASDRGQWDVVRALVDHGADVNGKAKWQTALMIAARHGPRDIVRLLLSKGARVGGRGKTVGGYTALHQAVFRGDAAIVGLLLAARADFNAVDQYGRDALYCAATYNHVDVARLLLERGADINGARRITSWPGVSDPPETPLMAAVRTGKREMVAFLLEKGADVRRRQLGTGRTALDIAERMLALSRPHEGPYPEIIRLLKRYGA